MLSLPCLNYNSPTSPLSLSQTDRARFLLTVFLGLMEPAKIDWENIESVFVEDKLYENINAPKWVDFYSPDKSIDDESWFCRPDCNHPKTAEDFLISTPTSKPSRAEDDSKSFLSRQLNIRTASLNRRGQNQSTIDGKKFNENGENQNPNLSAPSTLTQQAKSKKSVIKSSSEKKKPVKEVSEVPPPRLKSSLSARNLFAGRDIMNHITEFCNELKRMASRKTAEENQQFEKKKEMEVNEEGSGEIMEDIDLNENDRKPLIEVTPKDNAKSNGLRRPRTERAENMPMSLNMENVKKKGEDRLLQIRTNPPSPQCFSAKRLPTTKPSPPKGFRSKPMERGILKEVKHTKDKNRTEQEVENTNLSNTVDGREQEESRGGGGGLDVFWFLKPCTMAN